MNIHRNRIVYLHEEPMPKPYKSHARQGIYPYEWTYNIRKLDHVGRPPESKICLTEAITNQVEVFKKQARRHAPVHWHHPSIYKKCMVSVHYDAIRSNLQGKYILTHNYVDSLVHNMFKPYIYNVQQSEPRPLFDL